MLLMVKQVEDMNVVTASSIKLWSWLTILSEGVRKRDSRGTSEAVEHLRD